MLITSNLLIVVIVLLRGIHYEEVAVWKGSQLILQLNSRVSFQIPVAVHAD